MELAEESLSRYLWRSRYRDPDAAPPESALADTWSRVARAVAAVEADSLLWQRRFLDALQGYRFLPSGRILAGAGSSRHVTLFSCFVMGPIEDSLSGIFEALKEGALTMQQGGGVGYDFSTLRPRGSGARSSGMVASGPVSFMHVWDAMCATIVSTGARRGAMMATLRCDHPDIEEFIDAKRAPEALRYFNLSVLVSDAFMQAVREDSDWPLVFPESTTRGAEDRRRIERGWSGSAGPVSCRIWRSVPARQLWARLCDSAHACAEPGVLYVDRINAENNLGYCEHLSATNPCAEEPLPPYGACNLSSLNLAAFVSDPFTSQARVEHDAIREAVRVAVRFLDDVLSISRFPLERQREQALRARRLGLGITGLADALAMLRLRYDTQPARDAATEVMALIRDTAYQTSIELARERGAFPAFEAQRYLERPFIQRLPAELREDLRRHGIRNSHLLAIAPTGTISLLADNISSGIEPIFRREGRRRVLDPDGRYREFAVRDAAYTVWRAGGAGSTEAPEYFLDQTGVRAQDQLAMLAAVQPFVDGSISKTVTLGSDASAADVARLLETAYDLKLKGCTVFREQARAGVLTGAGLDQRQRSGAPVTHCCDVERESD